MIDMQIKFPYKKVKHWTESSEYQKPSCLSIKHIHEGMKTIMIRFIGCVPCWIIHSSCICNYQLGFIINNASWSENIHPVFQPNWVCKDIKIFDAYTKEALEYYSTKLLSIKNISEWKLFQRPQTPPGGSVAKPETLLLIILSLVCNSDKVNCLTRYSKRKSMGGNTLGRWIKVKTVSHKFINSQW